MHKTLLDELCRGDVFTGDVLADEPMKNHTTLRIGGPADLYVSPANLVSTRNLLRLLRSEGMPMMPAGGGSNMLVSDNGFRGAVISTQAIDAIDVIEEGADQVRLFVEAGASLQKLLNLSKERGYGGIEGLAGIPGSVGGAAKGNAGSFGFEIGSVIESVTVIQGDGSIALIERKELDFGYRSTNISNGAIILSLNLRLRKNDPDEIARRIHTYLRDKRMKQPLSARSAGCVFKNPEGAPAGRLIDEAHCKGMKRGGIEVSTVHANYFINSGDGTAAAFVSLMDEVKERVMNSSGIVLEPEIKFVGSI